MSMTPEMQEMLWAELKELRANTERLWRFLGEQPPEIPKFTEDHRRIIKPLFQKGVR